MNPFDPISMALYRSLSAPGLDTPYGPQPEPDYTPPPFRSIPAPAAVMPPVPGPDQMQPEVAPFIPHERPDPITALLSGFAQLPYGGAALLGRHADPLAYLLLGLASGYGRARLGNYRAQEQNTSELNRRFGLAAAERNRINIEASKAAEKERISSAKEQSKAEAKKKEDAAQKAADKAARDAEKVAEAENPRVGMSDKAISAGLVGRPYKTLTPQERAIFAAVPRAGAKPSIGPVIPTLASRATSLLRQASEIRKANFGQTTAEADSVENLGNEFARIHNEIRLAQTPEDLALIQVPAGLPPDLATELANASRFRRSQFAKPR